MCITGSVALLSVSSLKWHCPISAQVHRDKDTHKQWQWQHTKILLAQQGICLPIIRDLVAVCRVKSPSQHTVVPVVPLQETLLLFLSKEKHRGCLPLRSFWQQACRTQCMGMAEDAEVNTVAELYRTGQADISQKKAQRSSIWKCWSPTLCRMIFEQYYLGSSRVTHTYTQTQINGFVIGLINSSLNWKRSSIICSAFLLTDLVNSMALEMAMTACWLVHHFGLEWNVSKTIKQNAITVFTGINGLPRLRPTNFGNPQTSSATTRLTSTQLLDI